MADLQIILKKYLTGDNQAVAELYSCLKDRLLLIAYNYSRDKEISRDIVQDIIEKMIRLHVEKRLEYFGSSGSNIEAYLSVAIKNKCKDLYKVKSNRENIIHSIRHLFTNIAENDSQDNFCKDGLKEMLNNLQPREQEIIQLHLDGYSNEEIAANLNITYNTVNNNIYESKKKLKKIWNLFMN